MSRTLAALLLAGAMAAPLSAQEPALITVVYFDLGNTLVKRVSDATRPTAWIPGSREALGQLRASGVRLGILSNTGNFSWEQVQADILPEDFDLSLFQEDLIVVSSAVGAQKPDPAIFTYAIEQSGRPAEEILFITESVDHVIAAQATGMRALWLTEGQLPVLVNDLLARNLVGSR